MPDAPTLRQWLEAEPFALGMSSGFFGFFAHCGMLTVLEDAGLRPTRVSGSSAGALIAGAWASGLDGPDIATELLALRRVDFWDPWPGLGLLRGRKFAERLDRVLRVDTFAECRVPLAVSAFDVFDRRTRVLDRGPLAPAVRASCSVPFLFQPVWIDRRPYLDGGVSDRPGLAGMPIGERLLFHHLASRSPWRGKKSHSMCIPERDQLTALVIEDLPRLSPFNLEGASDAYNQARAATSKALAMPIREGMVRLSAN